MADPTPTPAGAPDAVAPDATSVLRDLLSALKDVGFPMSQRQWILIGDESPFPAKASIRKLHHVAVAAEAILTA